MVSAPSVLKRSVSNLPKGAWLVVALLCVVGCLNYLDRMMITTMRVSIRDSIPMTDGQFGLLTSVFLWIYGILSPVAGFFADRFSRSRVIIVSLFIWSGVTWLTAHATTFNQLLATRALMGISEACYIPAAFALVIDYHRGSTRSLATGIHMAGIMIGQSLGFLGGWIAEEHNWSYAFSVFGIVGVSYAVILMFTLKDAPRTELPVKEAEPVRKINFFEAMKDLFGRRDFILLLSFYGLLGIVGWLIAGWLPTYYKEKFNLTQTMAGVYATGYLHPATLVGAIAGGYLSDRWSRINPRARILLPIIGLCIAAPAVFVAGTTGVLAIAIICFMIYGITRVSSDVNMMPIICMITDKRYRATALGILNLFSCVVGGVGLYAGGVLRDANVNLANIFRTASISMLVCALILYMIKAKGRIGPGNDLQ